MTASLGGAASLLGDPSGPRSSRHRSSGQSLGRGQLPAGRVDLRRPRRGAGRRRARRPAARLPAGRDRLGRRSARRCTSTGCAPSRRTSAGYSPMARPRGRRHYRLRETAGDVLALLDAAGPRAARTSSATTWGGMVAWALGAWHPDRVRTLTALSVAAPRGHGRRPWSPATRHCGRTTWALFQLPLLPERLLLSRGGNAAAPDAARRRPVQGGGRPLRRAHAGAGRPVRRARLVPRAALQRARPGREGPGADAARLEHRRRLPRPGRHRGDRAVRRRARTGSRCWTT